MSAAPVKALSQVHDIASKRRIETRLTGGSAVAGTKRSRDEDELQPDGESVFQVQPLGDATGGAEDGDGDDIYGASTFGGFGDYMRRKRVKLQIQNAQAVEDSQSEPKPAIFKGVSIWVNGRTDPSAFALRTLVLEHGGAYHDHMDRKGMVSHVIASNLTPAKWRELQNLRVVKPDWLVESVKVGKLLPWRRFRLEPVAGHDDAQGVQTGPAPAPRKVSRPRPHNPFSVSELIKRRDRSFLDDLSSPLPDPNETIDVDADTSMAEPPAAEPSNSPWSQQPPLVPLPTREDSPEYLTDPLTMEQANKMPGYAVHNSNLSAQKMMSDPTWRAQHTSTADGFIENYYKASRLHHLSMWKSELRDLVAKAQKDAEEQSASQVTAIRPRGVSMRGATLGELTSPKRQSDSKKPVQRVIMHCDFDCFFVAAGLVSRPELKGKPVVVCHSLGNGKIENSTSEVASSSYEARAFGIRNGMSLGQAHKLCPEVKPIPYEFECYKTFALRFYTILMQHCDDLEAVSVDEALLDVSSRVGTPEDGDDDEDPARTFALAIQDEVRAATGCTISIGVSENVLLARLATRRAKPGGVYHLLQRDAQLFMSELRVTDIRGFAHSARQKLEAKYGEHGATVREITNRSEGELCALLGQKTGKTLYQAVRGIDETALQSNKPRKSVSAEVNYGIRFQNNDEFKKFLDGLAEEVCRRLQDIGMRGRQVTLKLMTRHPNAPVEAAKFLGHGICDVHNKSSQLDRVTDDPRKISAAAWKLADEFAFDPTELRGIGLQLQKLEGDDTAAKKQKDAQSIRAAFKKQEKRPQAIIDDDVFCAPGLPASASVALTSKGFQPPTLSQVDQSVLDELPEDIQRELRAEWEKQASNKAAATFNRASSVHLPHPSPNETPGAGPSRLSPAPSPQRSRSLTPSLPTHDKDVPDVRHISKQLAPRNAGTSPTKRGGTSGPKVASIFSRAAKAAEQPLQVPLEKLRHLGIDPDVFFALPVADQREQLRAMEHEHDKQRSPRKNVLAAAAATKRFSRSPSIGRERVHARMVPRGVAPIVAVPDVEPSIVQRLSRSKEVLHIRSTEDVQALLGRWVDSAIPSGKAPELKTDVPVFEKYLVSCVEQEIGSAAVERAVNVMRWWKLRIERLAAEPSFNDKPAAVDAWRGAFATVKQRLDDEIVKRFGCPLSLE